LSKSSNVEGISQQILRGPHFSQGFHCVFYTWPPAQFEISELVKKEEDNRRKKPEFFFSFCCYEKGIIRKDSQRERIPNV
jgi:hypothetical protein